MISQPNEETKMATSTNLPAAPLPGDPAYRLIGYFPSWVIHTLQYHVTDIPADRLNYVNYAFAGVSADELCVSVNAAQDQFNFPLLIQMKQQRPNVQTLISVGGAANSANFPAAVANPTALAQFAQSCVQFMKQDGFDGIEIDWEYPDAARSQTFTALLTELRHELDALGATDKRSYLLKIAAPAGSVHYSNLQLNLIHPALDWINLMAYDPTFRTSLFDFSEFGLMPVC
jgi:chitinase